MAYPMLQQSPPWNFPACLIARKLKKRNRSPRLLKISASLHHRIPISFRPISRARLQVLPLRLASTPCSLHPRLLLVLFRVRLMVPMWAPPMVRVLLARSSSSSRRHMKTRPRSPNRFVRARLWCCTFAKPIRLFPSAYLIFRSALLLPSLRRLIALPRRRS